MDRPGTTESLDHEPTYRLTTSDDEIALLMLCETDDVAEVARTADGLAYRATQDAADGVVLDLAMAGIAVRTLAASERRPSTP